MKVLYVEVWRFGSYPHLKFEFDGVGLALVHGPTGAGKSTLMDIIPWVLFGQTAKGGSVEQVRSWQAMEESTAGVATVQVTNNLTVRIVRRRGKTSQNDLYYFSSSDFIEQRGKDLGDTQKKLETLLGITAETYLTGAYFHEFSPTGLFFSSKPKAQRALLEQIAPLDFAINIGSKASDARKAAKRQLEEAQGHMEALKARLEALCASKEDSERRQVAWDVEQVKKVKNYTDKLNNFETEKQIKIAKMTKQLLALESDLEDPLVFSARLQQLANSEKCHTCQAVRPEISSRVAEIREQRAANNQKITEFRRGQDTLQAVNAEVNFWGQALEELKEEVNPFIAQVAKLGDEIHITDLRAVNKLDEVEELSMEVSRLSLVYDISFELRGILLTQAVQEIQDATNRYLHDYFDAEIKVRLAIEGSDSLEVRLQKSGYDCVYTQLSKGQRGMLRLAFGISVMKAAANASGVHFDTIFFDEALDGLDGDLKVKAFRLFERLATEHSGVLVIDHSVELQERFPTKFQVSMTGDTSEIVVHG